MTASGSADQAEGWDFFVSYTGVDRGWAEWVAWQLESSGYRVLIRAWDFVAGSDWAFQMDRGIRLAQRTIALLSYAYLQSVYGRQEWQAARIADPAGFARRLLPVRIEDCPRPGMLSTVVSIDLFGQSSEEASRILLDQIRGAVEGRGKPTAAPAFPARAETAPPLGPPGFPVQDGPSTEPAATRSTELSAMFSTGPHGREVRSVAFSGDGLVLAAGYLDGAVRLWNVSDPAHPRQVGEALTGPAGAICSVAFAPDGRTCTASCEDHTLWRWDALKPAAPWRTSHSVLTDSGSEVRSMVFSPDNGTLACSGSDHTVRLWEVTGPARPRQIGAPLTGHTAVVWSLAFAHHGETLATVSGPRVRLWDVAGPRGPRLTGETGTGGGADLCSVAFSPNGLVAAGGFDRGVRLWDAADPTRPQPVSTPPLVHTAAVWSLAFAPDGRTLATADGRTARLWDVTDPERPREIGPPRDGHTSRISCAVFAPGGGVLATGSEDGTVRLWTVESPRPVRSQPAPGGSGSLRRRGGGG